MTNEIRLLPPRRSTVVESIVEQLVNQIQSGALNPGDRLPPERQLIDMLGVSRSSVREALQGLAAMGLVEIRHGEGTFVKKTNGTFGIEGPVNLHPQALQKELRLQINHARFTLESGIIADACAKITPASATAILDAYDACYHAVENYAPQIEWGIHDRIHLSIAQATGNRILVHMLQSLLDLVPNSLREGGVLFGSPQEIQVSFQLDKTIHQELCQAIIRGDTPCAQEWMVRHAQQEDAIINRYYGDTSSPGREQHA